MKSLYFEPMAYLDAKSFRNKAETCRSLARHITDERELRALRDLIAENTAKAEELERLGADLFQQAVLIGNAGLRPVQLIIGVERITAGNIRQVWSWLVLVASSTRFFARRLAYWSICHELRSLSPRNEYGGADRSMTGSGSV
jgi:hypothetical protein